MAPVGQLYAQPLRPAGAKGGGEFIKDGETMQFLVKQDGGFINEKTGKSVLFLAGLRVGYDGEFRLYLHDFQRDSRIQDSAQLFGKTVELTSKQGKWIIGRFQ